MSSFLRVSRKFAECTVKRNMGSHDLPTLKKYEKFWTAVCIGGVPVGIVLTAYVYANYEHPKRIPFKPYEYMYKRGRPFPWGDGNHTFFHNPHLNAVPGVGYEADEH